MRFLLVFLLFTIAVAEFWTVHINAKLKCNGKTVKERLNYDISDANYTRFDRDLRTVTRGRTRSQGWIILTATKRIEWVPLITIYHKCEVDKDTKCYKTLSIPIPREVMSTQFPKSYNLTGDESYLNLSKPPRFSHIGTDCTPYFEMKRRH